MEEEWRDIVGYEGLYQVSNTGKVKSLNYNKTGKQKILKAGKGNHGYLLLQLWKDRKPAMHYIHRLVAKAFIHNPLNLPEINHRDENKENNCISNLEFCTHEYNIRYGTCIERRSIARGVKIKCLEMNKIFNSSVEVEKELGLNKGNIISCCQGKRKSCGGLHWEYAS